MLSQLTAEKVGNLFLFNSLSPSLLLFLSGAIYSNERDGSYSLLRAPTQVLFP
jgi:hypothetical protein